MIHPHTLVALVTLAALLVLLVAILRVSMARRRFGVKAPAVSGDEMFERHLRIQVNTTEQMVLFLPSLWLFAIYVQNQYLAVALGVVWIIGRILYMASYAKDPVTRSQGYGLTLVSTVILMVGALIGAIRVLTVTGGA